MKPTICNRLVNGAKPTVRAGEKVLHYKNFWPLVKRYVRFYQHLSRVHPNPQATDNERLNPLLKDCRPSKRLPANYKRKIE